jgi:hypothetical protein
MLEVTVEIEPRWDRKLGPEIAEMDVAQATPKDLISFPQVIRERRGMSRIQGQDEIAFIGETAQIAGSTEDVPPVRGPEYRLVLQAKLGR